MIRVVQIVDRQGNCEWYLDGVYAGHDDQIGVEHLMKWFGGHVEPVRQLDPGEMDENDIDQQSAVRVRLGLTR